MSEKVQSTMSWRGELSKTIIVPPAMRQAVRVAMCERWGYSDLSEANIDAAMAGSDHNMDFAIEEALRWLSENPIVPTHPQYASMMNDWREGQGVSGFYAATEWQRRMFLAPEKESTPDGVVEYLAGTTRPIAVWWQNNRWPIQTLFQDSEQEKISDLFFQSEVREKWRTMTGNERIAEAYRRGKEAR